MTRLLPLHGLIKNLRSEFSETHRAYLDREKAYRLLKDWTGQDFGEDIEAWENWIKEHPHEILPVDRQIVK